MQYFEELLFTVYLGCHHVDSEDARLRANASHQDLPKCPVIQHTTWRDVC
jgi:precorrin-4 methylase